MELRTRRPFEAALPPDDAHPYRTGPWRPQDLEHDAWDLEVVGEVPADLSGVYLRNTENPLLESIKQYHPFDGDGMLHAMAFDNGEAVYRNRFVPTDGLLAEQAAGEALWAGLAEEPALAKVDYGWGARSLMKDASSTDVVVHRGMALTSFYQCGDLYRADAWTLEPQGRESWGGSFPADGASAHCKVDENTGEMLFFNYSTEAPYMHYGVVSATGELVHYTDVPLPGPRLPHDMAFTENYVILNDFPLYWDAEAMAAGFYAPRFHRDQPSRFAVLPRRGTAADIRWFEAEPTFVLHFMNAYEEGDEIVLDGFFQGNPSPKPLPNMTFEERMFRFLDLHAMESRPHQWRFDLVSGATKESRLSDRILEFGMMNGTYVGRPYRYSYDALPCVGWFGFEGIAKHDLQTGDIATFEFPEGVYCSETVMAPREGSAAEDDGYLITFTMDMNADSSACAIFDAADPTAGPIAEIALPERICSGTHATWAPKPTQAADHE